MSEHAETLRHAEIERIRQLLVAERSDQLVERLSDLHASDVADIVEHLDEDERRCLMEVLPAEVASEALSEMEDEESPGELLASLPPDTIAAVVEELADDDAADLIGELEDEDRERVLESVVAPEEIRELLEFPEDSAGGIMTREIVSVPLGFTASQARARYRQFAADTEDLYTIFVVDPEGRLRGLITLRDLMMESPGSAVAEFLQQPLAVADVNMDQEEAVRLLSRYNVPSVPVVDDRGELLGCITFDDALDIVEAEGTEDMLRFASVSEEEGLRAGAVSAVKSRLPWLAVNAATLSAAAFVVWFYEDTIAQLAVLAAAMPVIAGLGGNAGTQALAVTIRRIALAHESPSERWGAVAKELLVGVVNGFLIGALVAVVALALPSTGPAFGAVVMVAMWVNLVVASTLGAFFPIVLERLGIDPAVASSIFVTTFTDLLGFLLLLGLATRFLI